MLGWKYVKFDPNFYIFKYKNGKVVKEGLGLSFWYYAASASMIKIPIETKNIPFIFEETSFDYQTITIQGEIIYKISDPKQIKEQVNFSIDTKTLNYTSEDPYKLEQRIINFIKTILKKEISVNPLKEALCSSENLTKNTLSALLSNDYLNTLGIKVTAINILSMAPTKETSRALEAETRENILKGADDAIYKRRNFAVEQERIIKENELNTNIAIEQKNRQIRETQMETQRLIKEKERVMLDEEMKFKIKQEEENIRLTELSIQNKKSEADARAYALAAILEHFTKINPEIVRALASISLNPEQIIANAFDGLANQAGKIGELNISPDLLSSLLVKKK
ncbi:MAG TPA: membrane protease subunit, stomatin/prohibitin [Spirochaetia bacterium]|nr:MAG: membrane protease subunit, stomatin/prohibitin [Spirochaetes bacterium GWB1_36_13]HCL56005.1 membrane protease subunit, stomatin/prohibitin [Spirochaetia bacterium]